MEAPFKRASYHQLGILSQHKWSFTSEVLEAMNTANVGFNTVTNKQINNMAPLSSLVSNTKTWLVWKSNFKNQLVLFQLSSTTDHP
jgi:hypothetical protein